MTHAEYCLQFVPAGGRILDVGSGRGGLLCELARRGARAYGLELNSAYIQETVERAAKEGTAIKVEQGRAERLPYADNFFDFVNCAEVTEHVDDPAAVCREIYRVLKPGGMAYISFHNRFGFYDYHYRIRGINWLPRAWGERLGQALRPDRADSARIGRQRLTSMHYYTYPQVRRLIKKIGFMAEDIRVSKIKQRFSLIAPMFQLAYALILRPLYFNTFHILATKLK